MDQSANIVRQNSNSMKEATVIISIRGITFLYAWQTVTMVSYQFHTCLGAKSLIASVLLRQMVIKWWRAFCKIIGFSFSASVTLLWKHRRSLAFIATCYPNVLSCTGG